MAQPLASTMEQTYSLQVEEIRKAEYPSMQDCTYLDYSGSTPVAASVVKRFAQHMTDHLWGNPHSSSPSSQLSTRYVKDVRSRLLSFFRADPAQWELVFTHNTTAAIKLVAEGLRDASGSRGFWYGYHRDAHTSLVGVREYAAEAHCFESDSANEAFIKGLDSSAKTSCSRRIGLYAWPAQSNMTGRRLPLDNAGRLRRTYSRAERPIYTLLDAAAYCSTTQLDLSNEAQAPDFVALSLHKMFGFPDLGALLVRRTAGHIFQHRRYFGGGTVAMVTVIDKAWHSRLETLHELLEDGTLPFHQIVALDSALNVHAELFGSMDNISHHTSSLTAHLYRRLRALRHAGGLPVCEIYREPHAQFGNAQTQGPVVAFNVRNAQGGWVGKSEVEALAVSRNIHLRTGGVCNPGGIATFCDLEQWEMRRNYSEGMRCGDARDVLGGKPTGIVRVSLGSVTTRADVDHFMRFMEDIFVETELDLHPSQFPKPAADPRVVSTIKALQVIPIRGGPAWTVPSIQDWPLGPRGLAWNHEWCVVSTQTRRSLLSSQCGPLQSLKVELDVHAGSLRISKRDPSTERQLMRGRGDAVNNAPHMRRRGVSDAPIPPERGSSYVLSMRKRGTSSSSGTRRRDASETPATRGRGMSDVISSHKRATSLSPPTHSTDNSDAPSGSEQSQGSDDNASTGQRQGSDDYDSGASTLCAGAQRCDDHFSRKTPTSRSASQTPPSDPSSEVIVSLWETPSPDDDPAELDGDTSRAPADMYRTPDLEAFFTQIVGFPCTLARYRDPSRLSAQAGVLPARERPIIVTSSSSMMSAANILADGDGQWRYCQYVQMGPYFFENLAESATDTSLSRKTSHAHLEKHSNVKDFSNSAASSSSWAYLRNVYDRSRAAQHPTLSRGEMIRGFSAEDARTDPSLQACIASTLIDGPICPVWSCRRALDTPAALATHLPTHRTTRAKPALSRPAELKILQLAVTVPKSGAIDEISPLDSIPTPLSACSRRSSHRRSWRNRLSTMVRPSSIILSPS